METSGKIVEYLDNGKFICGFVTESQQKRVRLINQNGREVNLPLSRVVHCSIESFPNVSAKEAITDLLQTVDQERSIIMKDIHLETIWELASDESNTCFEPSLLTELSIGKKADDNSVAAFLRSVFKDRLYFKFKEGKIHVHSSNKVEQLRVQHEKEQKKFELIKNGAQTLNDLVHNRISAEELSESSKECLDIIGNYYLFGNDDKNSDISRQILKTAKLNRPHDPFNIMVKAEIWNENENIALLRQNLPVNFTTEAIQQAETILQTGIDGLMNDPYRIDMTYLSPLTIDGASTLDFDDALSIESTGDNYLVGIHISDVAHYVKPGDPLFEEAVKRCSSLYFPEGQIPMLPRHLSQGICSLIENELRASISFMILLDKDATVQKVSIKPSVIKVARRLTYDEADRDIDNDPELKILNMLRRKLRTNRLENGALLLPFPDVNIFIDPKKGNIQVSLSDVETPARTLISEMMILANTEAAKYLSDRMVPGLFRSQGQPRKRIVHGDDNDLFQNTLQRKRLARGELLTTAKQHCGLGVNQYTTITSPIRRFLDLIMQHQIHSVLRREEPVFSEETCRDYSSLISRRMTKLNNVKHQRHRYWLLKYLESRKGQLQDALVIDQGPKRTSLLLIDLMLDIDLPSIGAEMAEPGNTVQVRIASVDALDNSLRFEWI